MYINNKKETLKYKQKLFKTLAIKNIDVFKDFKIKAKYRQPHFSAA